MVADSGARMVVISHQLAGLVAQLGPVLAPGVRRLMIGGTSGQSWRSVAGSMRPERAELAELAERLDAHCREHLAGFECPRSYEFTTGGAADPGGQDPPRPLREQFGAAPGCFRPTYRA